MTPTAFGSFRRSAWWLAVALVGQAATLQLIDAGNLLRYQHYPPLGVLLGTHPWALALIAIQVILVGVALARGAHRGVERFAPMSRTRLLIAVLLSVVTAATVSQSVWRYLGELSFAAFLQILAMATIVLAVMALPDSVTHAADRALDRVFGKTSGGLAPDATMPAGPDYFGWTCGLVTTVLAATLSIISYERHPHVPDEVVYFLHARYFAEGMLTMAAPPVPAAFDLDLMMMEPARWFSPVPPGWPAVLALGAFWGVPWLVNPVLAGLSVQLAYVLLKNLYSRRIARYAAGLLALSPWFLFLGMSYMTHMLTLASALVAAVAVARARRTGSFVAGVVGGIGVGATSLIRPLDGLLVGILIALWAMGAGAARLRFAALAGLAIGTVGIGALQFPYNRLMTGDALQFPINAYIDAHHTKNANAYGFGPDRGMGWAIDPNPGHGPVDGIINTNLNAFGLNTDLFGWSTGSLILVAFALCSGSLTRNDRAMIAVVFIIVTGYFFYYFSGGPDFGARYWFPVIVPLVALSARGLEVLERTAGARAPIAVLALVAMSLVTFVPWRAVDKYRNFRGMRGDVQRLAAEHPLDGDLVLVRGDRHPDYAAAAVLNPVDLKAPATIYAWDVNADVTAETLRAFPNRRVWMVDGPSITGSGYVLREGPIEPQAPGVSDTAHRPAPGVER